MADEAPTGRYDALVTSEDGSRLLGVDAPIAHHDKVALGIEQMAPGLVTLRRMDDIQALTRSRDVRQFGIGGHLRGPGELGLGGHHVAIPLELDGPEHTKWRKILDPVFAPRRVQHLEAGVRARADELIDAFVDLGEVDAYQAWAEPLPSSIFLSIMGIPQTELDHFLGFKNVIISSGSAAAEPPTLAAREAAFTDAENWFAAEFDRREASGSLGDDLIGWLLQVEVDGRAINRDELHGICNLLMIAGLDTVAASLSCILSHLARHPELRQSILDEPSLWPSAIEELMRYESPVATGFRHTVADVELPSGTLPSGTNAFVLWAAANVDPGAFEDPLEIRLDRSPNPHISFASGWHRCLGSHLARMELRCALDVWHQRIPDYRVAEGVELVYSLNPRAPHHLPLVW